jgi:hypothetical protein
MATPRHALTDPAQTMSPRTHTLQGVVSPVPCRQDSFPAQGDEHGHQDHGHQHEHEHHTRISVHAAATTASYV